MAVSKLSDVELRRELSDYKDLYPRLADDHLFVLWFLRTFLTESMDEAANALTGGAHDKGIDAILVDQNTKRVFIVQGKYREKIGKKQESRSDLISFSGIALDLSGDPQAILEAGEGLADQVNRLIHYAQSGEDQPVTYAVRA